jgi:hypothetical protein
LPTRRGGDGQRQEDERGSRPDPSTLQFRSSGFNGSFDPKEGGAPADRGGGRAPSNRPRPRSEWRGSRVQLLDRDRAREPPVRAQATEVDRRRTARRKGPRQAAPPYRVLGLRTHRRQSSASREPRCVGREPGSGAVLRSRTSRPPDPSPGASLRQRARGRRTLRMHAFVTVIGGRALSASRHAICSRQRRLPTPLARGARTPTPPKEGNA